MQNQFIKLTSGIKAVFSYIEKVGDKYMGFFSSGLWIGISAVISVVGLIGTILGIYQYIKSSKELREYKYLFRIAGQHVDLEDKKNEIQDYNEKIEQLQKVIKEQIPEEAKKIALKAMLDNEMSVLSAAYTKVRKLQAEIEEVTSDDLSENEELMGKVNKIIEPTYSRKRSDNLFSTVFYLVSVISSVLSIILPYGTYKLIMLIVFFFQLFISIRTIINFLQQSYTRKERANMLHKAYLITAIALLVLFLFIAVLLFYGFITANLSYIVEETFAITLLVVFAAHLIFGVMYCLKASKRKIIAWAIVTSLVAIIFIISILCILPILYVLGIIITLVDMVFLLICLFSRKAT